MPAATMPRATLKSIALGLSLLALGACQATNRTGQLSVSSDPPGAKITIDGRDIGFVTPCLLDGDALEPGELSLSLPGYATASRNLTRIGQTRVIFWSDMLASPNTWHFPLFLNYEDFFRPVQHTEVTWPARIFVRLERAVDQ
ncbi:MAG: PEGA domain-containing protein [Planctomycetota bacterium]|jgi:hypothetical protein|nr:PEGA domain-containing protein [Planctomycetota bacterium]MDP6955686.1 PEGA domain-containing protein [Planctomycetota bacterium]